MITGFDMNLLLVGMIHSHGVIFSPTHAEKIHDALNSFTASQSNTESNDVAFELERILQSTEFNNEIFYLPEFVSKHPAGCELINDKWCPGKENWSKPEGSAKPSEQNPLEKSIESVSHLKDGINKLHLDDMCNKIGLHKCGIYCLKKIKSKCGEKSKDKRVCQETKMSTGKDFHPFNPIITRGEHPRYEGKYDHPRFLQHIKCRLLSWKGNCDTQVIIGHLFSTCITKLSHSICM